MPGSSDAIRTSVDLSRSRASQGSLCRHGGAPWRTRLGILASEFGNLRRFSWLTDGGQLVVEATDSPVSAVLTSFFEGYDEAFILPNEKEKLQGFEECLALNQGELYASLSSCYGPFREIVLVMRDGPGTLIGGANLIAFPLELAEKTILSLNLNYLFVQPCHRRRGYLGEMVKAVQFVARSAFEPPALSLPLITFIEQNDPLRMSSEDYERDTAHSGLDQFKRIEIWSKLGARIVDFEYVQPALSPDQQPDTSLVYAVLGAEEHTLDPCLLLEHLRRFFGISVLKGKDLASDATASSLLGELSASCARGDKIPLLSIQGQPFSSRQIMDKANVPNLRALLKTTVKRRKAAL